MNQSDFKIILYLFLVVVVVVGSGSSFSSVLFVLVSQDTTYLWGFTFKQKPNRYLFIIIIIR